MRRARRVLLAIWCVAAGWYGLLITHEAGHVLHAWLSGGRVERVVIPLVGFSRTDLSHNPRPVFVAWGGFVWGVLIPCIFFAGSVLTGKAQRVLGGVAAAALIGNGVYACSTVGDVEDVVRSGGARWPLLLFGITAVVMGVFLLDRVRAR